MPQDKSPEEQTTARDGGTDTSIDSDNAPAEIVVTASAAEVADAQLRAELEQEIAEAEAEIQELRRLYEAETDPAVRAELEDLAYHAQADGMAASAELYALNNFEYAGSIDDFINNEAGPFGGPGVFVPMDQQTGLQRRQSLERYIPDYYAAASGLDIIEPTFWDLLPGGQLRRLERLRRLRRAMPAVQRAAAKRRAQERILGRRRRRKQRRCPISSGNPVLIDSGAVQQIDPVFGVPGLITLTLSSIYQSNLDVTGPLGWGRVSDLDASLERMPDGKLRYRDGAGFHVDFDRPTPNPGQWNVGDHVRVMEIAAGPDRTFLVREEGVIRHFAKRKDGGWSLFAIENRNGARILFERDSADLLQAITTPEGLRLEMTNDAARGLRTGVDLVASDGSRVTVMRYAYDSAGNMTLAECPFGDKHEYAYDAAHRRIWFRKNDQYEGRYHFDAAGRCVLEETNGPYNGTRFEYDPDRGITRHIPGGDPDRTELFYYGADGGVFAEAHISGRFKRTYHDEAGNISCTQDGEGNRTHFRYDEWGNVTSIEDAEGRISDFRWTEDGEMEFAIDPSGATWESDYDENGNLIGTTDPLGFNTQIKVNAMGQPTGICRHDGMIRALSYDKNHRLTGIVDFDGREVTFLRDAFGRVIRETNAESAVTHYDYTPQPGLDFWTPSATRPGDGIAHRREVIEPRRLLRQLDGSGRRTDFWIDGFGKVEAIEDAKGGRLSFRYDHQEELFEVENQMGQIWRFVRDGRGRIVSETDFGGAEIRYDYDEADRLVASTYPDGTRNLLTLDKAGLLTKEVVESPGHEPLETSYVYDERGLLKEARNADATVTFERDKAGQVISETINGTRIETTWDCCGRRASRVVGEEAVTYSYDPAGRLSGIEVGGHSPLIIKRDTLGLETARVSAMGFRLQQRFNAMGLLLDQRIASALTLAKADGAPLGVEPGRSYRWNASVEPEVIDDAIWGTKRYSYDANGQVTRTVLGDGATEGFGYDKRHNLAATTFGGAADQALALAERLFGWGLGPDGRVTEAQGPQGETIRISYDAKGRMVQKTVLVDGFRPRTWRFEWNGLDRMTVAHTPDGASWTYGYDAFARRLWKQEWRRRATPGTVTQIDWQPGVRHDFLWDGDVIARETVTSATGVRQVSWIHEPGTFVPLARVEAGRLSFVVTDHLGTPRELVSETGALEWAADYRTWGRVRRIWSHRASSATMPAETEGNLALNRNATAALADCPIRFQGQWEDLETGLHYNRFRYYEPAVGYASGDPIGLVGGYRPFAYVTSPVNELDPLGLNAALRRALGMSTGNGMQAHHVIPKEIWALNQSFFNNIGMGGQRDVAANGIALPNSQAASRRLGLPWHCGSHPIYSIGVQGALQPIVNDFNAGRITAAEARTRVAALQNNLRTVIRAMPGGTRIR
jgi:RHS repeat-associated protein